jgi:hypothetical protein
MSTLKDKVMAYACDSMFNVKHPSHVFSTLKFLIVKIKFQ